MKVRRSHHDLWGQCKTFEFYRCMEAAARSPKSCHFLSLLRARAEPKDKHHRLNYLSQKRPHAVPRVKPYSAQCNNKDDQAPSQSWQLLLKQGQQLVHDRTCIYIYIYIYIYIVVYVFRYHIISY